MKNLRAFDIIAYLKKRKHCSLAELMEQFHVSQATIHRDVAALVERGLVQKLHGGVAILEEKEGNGEGGSPYTERLSKNRAAKIRISEAALKEIEEGDIIFLDSSTTAYYLAERLQKTRFASLTIITNSVTIIQQFHLYPPHYVLVGIGGAYDLQLNSFLGESAIAELAGFSITKAFISAYGVDRNHAMTNHEHHAFFLRRVLENSACRFLLADSSKYGRAGLFKIARTKEFTRIIGCEKINFSTKRV